MATAKKATSVKVVGSVADRAAKSLNTANTALEKTMASLTDVVKQVATATETLDGLVYDIEAKQVEKDKLDADYQAKVREAEADLAISLKENEETQVNQLLRKQNRVAISTTDLETLERKAASNEETLNKTVKAAEAIAFQKGKAEGEGNLSEEKSKASIASAKFESQIEAKDLIIEQLKSQVVNLQDTIGKEREARVKEAEARSGAQVVQHMASK